MTTPLADLSIREFINRLASKAPTPGGGSVAALTGALGAGLAEMTCAYTLGKPKFAAAQNRISEIAAELARAQGLFLQLMEEDAAAYADLNTIFKLDKSAAGRAEKLVDAACIAAAVPAQIASLAHRVAALATELRSLGNPQLRSDVECALHLSHAACNSAIENVRVNLSLLPPDTASRLQHEIDALTQSR